MGDEIPVVFSGRCGSFRSFKCDFKLLIQSKLLWVADGLSGE